MHPDSADVRIRFRTCTAREGAIRLALPFPHSGTLASVHVLMCTCACAPHIRVRFACVCWCVVCVRAQRVVCVVCGGDVRCAPRA